jgi:alpha-beta hydrolase superfamily lysophospholipase
MIPPPEGARDGFVVANGIRMYYVEQGQGPLVLLCHGFPEFWYSWRHQIGPLADAGFHVAAVDLPGYGRSDKPDRSYDVKWLTACLSEAIQGLGHERAVLAGHDWGGLLVWPFRAHASTPDGRSDRTQYARPSADPDPHHGVPAADGLQQHALHPGVPGAG